MLLVVACQGEALQSEPLRPDPVVIPGSDRGELSGSTAPTECMIVNAESFGTSDRILTAYMVGVFGTGLSTLVRDCNVTHATDDSPIAPQYQRPSWTWASTLANIGTGGGYPLEVQKLTNDIANAGSGLSGGAADYRTTVPANAAATVSLTEQSGAAPTLSLVTVRIT